MGKPQRFPDAAAAEATDSTALTRYDEGWRAGKPVEDPASSSAGALSPPSRASVPHRR